ncbi:TIR domain-containing protein [Nonomuraea bangladeshensis]|uniref:TIR domain-containing protein n=1 Tax=Nonomuraea bangladeshensis TaxID=404385 RepID=UPI003C30D866
MDSSQPVSEAPLAEVRMFLSDGTTRSSGHGDEIGIGAVRFGTWQVHALSSPRYATDAYLVRVTFDLELAPEVPGPRWAEVGFEFCGSGAYVLDAAPRSVLREQDSQILTLTSHLQFVVRNSPASAESPQLEIPIGGLTPTIVAFGIGRRALRWRHIATTGAGVPVGSHTAWLVLEVPSGEREVTVRFTAACRLAPEDEMGLTPGAEPVQRTVPLPVAEMPARRARDAGSDHMRRVFLIHGRDDEFAGHMRELLSLLGLRVMEWEPLVADAGHGPSPVLSDVIHNGFTRAQAIVALLTPDDVVALHPDLHLPREDWHELSPRCQPRPNVLMELGAALFAFRQHTIVLKVGDIRPMADLGGLNYVDFDGSATALRKLVQRLRTAGCEVDDSGSEWGRASRFEGLTTYARRPPGTAGGPAV